MAISVFDIFKIGIGPSSSHTVGPMRAALTFAEAIKQQECIPEIESITIELFGSLGATGKGHGSNKAIILGLLGESSDTIDPDSISEKLDAVRKTGEISLLNQYSVKFNETEHILYHRKALPFHANGMRFTARNKADSVLLEKDFYSVGGGFVVSETETNSLFDNSDACLPYPFKTADELLKLCMLHKCSFSHIIFNNEKAWLSESEIRHDLLHIGTLCRPVFGEALQMKVLYLEV